MPLLRRRIPLGSIGREGAQFALSIVHVDGQLVGRTIALSTFVGPLEFGSFELLKSISDLPPLIDKVQVHHTDRVILAPLQYRDRQGGWLDFGAMAPDRVA